MDHPVLKKGETGNKGSPSTESDPFLFNSHPRLWTVQAELQDLALGRWLGIPLRAAITAFAIRYATPLHSSCGIPTPSRRSFTPANYVTVPVPVWCGKEADVRGRLWRLLQNIVQGQSGRWTTLRADGSLAGHANDTLALGEIATILALRLDTIPSSGTYSKYSGVPLCRPKTVRRQSLRGSTGTN